MTKVLESAIAALEDRLARAVASCDVDDCSALLADDFTAVLAFEGQQLDVLLREEWLKTITRSDVRRFTVDDTAVSLHGDVAIATVLWTDHAPPSSTQLLVTDVWTRDGTEWKLRERYTGRPGVRAA